MSSNLRKVVGSFVFGAVSVAGAHAQIWSSCIDPQNNTPYSNDFLVGTVFSDLMVASMGFSGTVTYGGANGPCFAPNAITANVRGRIGFSVGPTGSVQTDFDDNMALTFGMPFEPGGSWSYACSTIFDPATQTRTKTLFGASALNLAFVGASHRYIYGETVNDTVRIRCRVDVIGDAARLQWTMTNEGDTRQIGLWFGQWIAMFAGTPDPATGGIISSGPGADKVPYVFVPGQKPPLTDRRWIRSQDSSNYPAYVNFNFGQTTAYGLRVENGPSASTTNPQTGQSDATQSAEFVVGKANFLLNAPDGGDNDFPDFIIPDTFYGQTAYIQKFGEQTVVGGGTRVITHYFRSTWGQANYVLPYTAVVDAPKLLATDDDGSGSTETNGLFKNPFPLRVYIDNVGGYSDIDTGFILNDVKVKVTLPTGLNFVGFPTTTRTRQLVIPQVQARQIQFVDFGVEADGIEFGDLQYQVDISSTPGGTKQIKGVVQVAATPRYRLYELGGPTANAITTPFVFLDSSWDVVLGLSTPTDYQAFEWDPQLKGYVLSTSAKRGIGAFIVNNTGGEVLNSLGGTPTTPPDTVPFPDDNSGRYPLQLKSGWNLIGNPYNYPITLGQITGVSASNPQVSRTWAQLVTQGIVNGSLASWNASTQTYKFTTSQADRLLPNTAYWIYVNTTADLTISFPPVFAEFLPLSSRAADSWTQTEKQWRLNITARNDKSIDDQNFIGVAQSTENANSLRIMEPPMAPTQEIGVSVEGTVNGQITRMAQSLSEKQGKQEFKVMVKAEKEGEVNLTWPNMGTVPKNVHFRLVDVATNTTRDMRSSSGYTFNATAGSTREFKVQIESGAISKPTIGNVVVTRSGRGPGSPFNINYTLSASAQTTIRILGSSGKEVFTVTRGRADNAGENTATWNLKDNANRSVAPGSYKVEIIATNNEGENVRRVVPVNVIR